MSRYVGKIKIICPDGLCFPVDPDSMEALGVGCFIPDAWNSSDGEVEKMSPSTWQRKRGDLWLH